MIISVHIPKTGGVSFRLILKHEFGDDLFIDYHQKPGSKQYRASPNPGYKTIPDNFKAIHGHFRAQKYVEKYPRVKYITWVREPISRIVSHYYYWKRNPDMSNSTCKEMIDNNCSILDFSNMYEIINLQSFYLHPMNISEYYFVGLTEYYELSIDLFKKVMGIYKDVSIPHENRNSPNKSTIYKLESSVEEKIRKINSVDINMYNTAKEVFIKKCQEEKLIGSKEYLN